jgi:subtilisin family serine protease
MQKAAKGFDIDGVAPEASLYMYRIGDCHRGFSDSVLKAFGKAHDDNVDILNLSMGSFFPWDGFQVDIYAEAVKSLTDAGIIVVAALGNSALAGTLKGGCPLYTGSVPAAESNVIAVGSVVNTNFPTVYSANDSVHTIRYASLYPVNITGDADVYFFKDACNASEWNNVLNTTREQVSKTIFIYQKSVKVPLCLLGRRGFYLTSALYQPAYIMEILANTTNSLNNLTDPYDSSYSPMMAEDIDSLESIQVASVNAADGERLRKAYESSGGYLKYKLSFANVTLISVTSPAGGMIDFSSSFGPVPGSLLLKPQLSAPGGAILSTFPMHTDGRGYTIMSGTSMATPYVTGCFALLKTQFPKANQSELISRLQVTSRPISWAYNSSMLAATPQQGAGLINAYDAIFSSTRISPSELTVQDVSLTEYGRVNITIENIDSQPQVYNFSHVGAGYMNKVGNHFDQLPIFGKAELDPAFYHSNITKITVWPGNSSVVQFAISPPSEVDRELEPLFSGFLVITSLTLNQIFHVPYVGKPY